MDSITDNKLFIKLKSKSREVILYTLLCVLAYRGVMGYWSDLKNHIIESELGKQTMTVTVDPKKTKYDKIREDLKKEKGILFTDEEIDKYGFNK